MNVARRTIVFFTAVALVVGGAIPSSARTSLKKKTARGDYAFAVVGANVNEPSALFVKVTAVPNQTVDVNWMTVCSKGFGAGSRDGDFSAQTPVVRRVKMPYRSPDDCTFSAGAQLSGEGQSVTVQLLAD